MLRPVVVFFSLYFIPGSRDNPHDERGRPSLLAPDILC